MIRHANILRSRDHLTAMLAALAAAYATGPSGLADWWPQGLLSPDRLPGQAIGTGICVLVYALIATWLSRRRLVTGPLYRCGASRPARDYGKRFEPGRARLLESWHYR